MTTMILIVKKWSDRICISLSQRHVTDALEVSPILNKWPLIQLNCSMVVDRTTRVITNNNKKYTKTAHINCIKIFARKTGKKNCATMAPKTRSILCSAKMPNCNNRLYKDYKLITKKMTKKLRENLDLRTTMSGRIWRTRKKSHVCLMVALSMMLYGCAAMM